VNGAEPERLSEVTPECLPEPKPEPLSGEPDLPIPGVVRDIDDNDREIFVEKYDSRRKPVVFYRYDSKNRLCRWDRDGFGSVCTGTVDLDGKRE